MVFVVTALFDLVFSFGIMIYLFSVMIGLVIGEYKKNHNIAILQTSRWDSLLGQVVEKGLEYGLPQSFIEDVFTAIHEASVEVQNEIISGKTSEQ